MQGFHYSLCTCKFITCSKYRGFLGPPQVQIRRCGNSYSCCDASKEARTIYSLMQVRPVEIHVMFICTRYKIVTSYDASC